MSRPDDLPDFERPPVVEVVLAVRFDPPQDLRSAHLGAFWRSRFAERLPIVDERPAYEAPIERYDVSEPGVNFKIVTGPPPIRHWFVSGDQSELLQLQHDWFARNWRKTPTGGDYPRYEAIRQMFQDDLGAFGSFVESEDLGTIRPDQCEVTYINHIRPNQYWSHPGEVARVIKTFTTPDAPSEDEFLPMPEDARLAWRYIMRDDDGTQRGRLHVELEPGVEQPSGEPLLRFSLTARGTPASPEIQDVLAFFDDGRNWIVRGFAELTTTEMHEVWGRIT